MASESNVRHDRLSKKKPIRPSLAWRFVPPRGCLLARFRRQGPEARTRQKEWELQRLPGCWLLVALASNVSHDSGCPIWSPSVLDGAFWQGFEASSKRQEARDKKQARISKRQKRKSNRKKKSKKEQKEKARTKKDSKRQEQTTSQEARRDSDRKQAKRSKNGNCRDCDVVYWDFELASCSFRKQR